LVSVCGASAALLALHPALAQDAPAPSLQRVEVTGSAIKRVESESSVPVTVFKMDDLKQQGLTTVEQIIGTVTGSQSTKTTSQSVGSPTGGASYADLRGLGRNKTLILLNGRRLTNNSFDNDAVDLNMIPIAAVDRVEVLRDGASSLYGSDAIGGVINFVTRKDFAGLSISAGLDSPEHGGGKAKNFNIGFGKGNLETDKFNIFGFLDYQGQDVITGSQRDFSGSTKTSPTPYPASYYQTVKQNGTGSKSVNPASTSCSATFLAASPPYNCAYYYWKWVDNIPKSERLSGMLKGTIALPNDKQINLEYFATLATVETTIAPVPYGALVMNPGTKYYPGNGITPAAPSGSGIDTTKPITVKYRDVLSGPRQDKSTNLQQRFVASLDGTLSDWDYQTALTYGQNHVVNRLTGGYTDGDIIAAGVKTGVINPFGAQDAVGTALINSAALTGDLLYGTSRSYGVDAKASREFADWFGAGRKPAVAVGADYRIETMSYKAETYFAEKVSASSGVDSTTFNLGRRNIFALYSELNIPITKMLDVTAAIRHDRYSDFGASTNPKLSFRLQPSQTMLFRGSYSTGFRAPSLLELYSTQYYTNTANSWNDPVRCPGGVPIAGVASAEACKTQFMSMGGGNTKLNPETSKNLTFGFVFQPTPEFDASVDFWRVELKHQIGSLSEDTVFGDPVKYASKFHRASDGSLSVDGKSCPGSDCGYIALLTDNLGGVRTQGIDFSGNYRLRLADAGRVNFKLVSTYVAKYEYQTEEGGEWINNLGVFSNGYPAFRWQHNFSATWAKDVWTVGAVGHYKSGYKDQDQGDDIERQVGSYTTWDLFGSWKPSKPLTVTFGVRNLFDRKPPTSQQTSTFQVGYDPRFTDITLRSYYLRANYRF